MDENRNSTAIGPTGEPPRSDDPRDRGGLNAALILDRKRKLLRMEFGTSVSFVTMTQREATILAGALIAKPH